MIYLTNTTRDNGCLKFLSGSHRKKHFFHESKNAHSEELARVQNPSDPLFMNEDNEIDVPTTLGDVVVGDARVLHAANPNQSNNKRSLITLWYHPHYNKMTDEMRSRIYHLYSRKNDDVETDKGGLSPEDWEKKYKDMIKPLSPNIELAKPTPWQRKPNWK
jgi:Protein involved in biosynthesis of mitomycin antibiotics/polyketide fumonisin